MQHTLKSKGAAFSPTNLTRVDPNSTGGSGVAVCSCGWTSEVLPSGKQRVAAHKEHKATPEPAVEEAKPEPTSSTKPEVYRDFPGNYSIAMVPFTQTLADAFGGITVTVERQPGLTRRVYLDGTKVNVKAFIKVLDPLTEEVMDALHIWQKQNLKKRKGLTDMQKYLQHRKFIEDFAKNRAKDL